MHSCMRAGRSLCWQKWLALLLVAAAAAAAAATAAAAAEAGEHPYLTTQLQEQEPGETLHVPDPYISNAAHSRMRPGQGAQGFPPSSHLRRLLQPGHANAPIHARAAALQPSAAYTPVQTRPLSGTQNPCGDWCTTKQCGVGCYTWDEMHCGGDPCCSWCVECSKGTFLPEEQLVIYSKPYMYHSGYYQCSPCCTCNQDGYTTASARSTTRDACNVCLPGYGRHEQLGGVPSCVCLPCPAGTYSGELVANKCMAYVRLQSDASTQQSLPSQSRHEFASIATACKVALEQPRQYITCTTRVLKY
jgi:hypothetical protein